LWLIESFMVACGTYLGVGLVAAAADELARRKSPTPATRDWLGCCGQWLLMTLCLSFVVFSLLTEVLLPFWD
jgi:hypothetical protein